LSTFPDGLFQYGGVPVGGLTSLGIGNVYWVIQSTNSAYQDFMEERQGIYHNDGSWRVHTTIASALTATVTERNDYVVVMPDDTDYTITATLAMDKRNVHLVCPAGLGYDVGCPKSARIYCSTTNTPAITLTGQCCEIAGFHFKNTASTLDTGAVIYASATAYYANIHNNNFSMVLSGGTNSPMIWGYNDALSYSLIHRNRFNTMTGASATIAAIVKTDAPCTGTHIEHNDFIIGCTCTCTTCVNNQSVMGTIKWNTVTCCGEQAGGMGAGTITNAFTAGTTNGVIGNMGAVPTATLISGGTASQSFCFNWDGITTTPEVVVD